MNIKFYLQNISDKLSRFTYLTLIKESFIELIPAILIGNIFTIVNNLPINAYQNFMTNLFGTDWRNFGSLIYENTFSILALLLVISLSKKISEYKELPSTMSILVSLVAFMIFLEPLSANSKGLLLLGTTGVFISIFSSILSLSLFSYLFKMPKLKIHIPDGEISETSKNSFNALLPALITILVFAIVKYLFSNLFGTKDLFIYFYGLIQAPFKLLKGGFIASMIYILMNQICWFLGIHGSAVTETLNTNIFIPAIESNIASVANNTAATNIFTKSFFDSFVYLGGCGATLCLAIALLLFSKKKYTKRLAIITILMGIFNVNELLVFGLPIVLNPLLGIPFILVPIILNIVSYLATLLNLVPITISSVHWTSPILLSGFGVTGSLSGSLLQMFNLALGIIIYMPFVKIYESSKYSTLNKIKDISKEILSGNLSVSLDESYTNRDDDIGNISRALNHTRKEFSSLIHDLKFNIHKGTEQSSILYDTSSKLSFNLENINLDLENSQQNSKNQYESLEHIKDILLEFRSDLSNIIDDINEVGSSANDVLSYSTKGGQEIIYVDTAMTNTSKSFNDFSNFMDNTNTSIVKVSELIYSIKDISKKTNILALNATIEASKVGEAGKGFSVVASEIRKLADDTNIILKEMIEKVSDITANLSFMDNARDSLGSQIKLQEKHSKTMIEVFSQIDSLVKSVNSKVINVRSVASNITNKNLRIQEDLIGSCEISKENLDKINNILNFSYEINDISKYMNQISDQIKTESDKLDSSISKYTI